MTAGQEHGVGFGVGARVTQLLHVLLAGLHWLILGVNNFNADGLCVLCVRVCHIDSYETVACDEKAEPHDEHDRCEFRI